MFQTLGTIWTVIWHLPSVLGLIAKIREVLGSEPIREIFTMILALIDRVAPESGDRNQQSGDRRADGSPAVGNARLTVRERLRLFRNRMRVACTMTDKEAQEYCDLLGK